MASRITLALACAGVVLAAWLTTVVAEHARQPVYDLPGYTVALGVGGGVAAVVGWVLVAWRRDPWILGVVLAALLLVAGVLAIFSIGIVLLLAFAGVVVVLGRAAQRNDRPVAAVPALAAAALAGLGLPLAGLAAADGPVVRCQRGGVSTSGSIFRSGDGRSSSQGSATSGGGTTEGEATVGGRHYRYRCEGERLVHFQAEDSR